MTDTTTLEHPRVRSARAVADSYLEQTGKRPPEFGHTDLYQWTTHARGECRKCGEPFPDGAYAIAPRSPGGLTLWHHVACLEVASLYAHGPVVVYGDRSRPHGNQPCSVAMIDKALRAPRFKLRLVPPSIMRARFAHNKGYGGYWHPSAGVQARLLELAAEQHPKDRGDRLDTVKRTTRSRKAK